MTDWLPETDGETSIWVEDPQDATVLTKAEADNIASAVASALAAHESELAAATSAAAAAVSEAAALAAQVSTEATAADVEDVAAQVEAVDAAVAAAAVSQAAAAASATNAATSSTAANSSATAAATSATNAATQATSASTAKTGAETARTGAETARTGAETARTGAETARTGAETAQTAAAASATAAAGSASTASTQAGNAGTSATAAAGSASAAASSASTAATQATNAAASAVAAAASAATIDPTAYFTKTALQDGSQELYLARNRLVLATSAIPTPAAGSIMVRGKKAGDFDALAYQTAAGEVAYARADKVLVKAGEVLPGGSSVATVDIAIPTDFNGFELDFEYFSPVTDGSSLYARFSIDGGATYIATGYAWAFRYTDTTATTPNDVAIAATTTEMRFIANQTSIATGIGACGSVKFWQPSNSGTNQICGLGTGVSRLATSALMRIFQYGGVLIGLAGSKVTHIRLFASAGNIRQIAYRLQGVQRVMPV